MENKEYFSLANVSYIHVGGLVKGFLKTNDIDKVKEKILCEKNILFVGNSSNILFSFDYKDVFVIKYVGKEVIVEDDFIVCESGVSLSYLAFISLQFNISSFYTFSLIPGLLGGAIGGNTSAYGKSISDDLLYIEVITKEGKHRIIKKEEIAFLYHNSSLKEENFFIYRAFFKKVTTYHDLHLIKSYYEYRKLKTQDYGASSLGSTFKNVNFLPIGKIINNEKENIFSCSECKFSSLHGNFLDISFYSSYQNILKLIESTSLLLYNKLGLEVDKEIEIVE